MPEDTNAEPTLTGAPAPSGPGRPGLHSTVLPGPVFPGPVFPGPVFPGPVFPGPVLPGPVLPGPVLPSPLLRPAYGGACLSALVPALMEAPGQRPGWLPGAVRQADQVVLLVLDGLGWLQLQARSDRAPNLTAMGGGPISSVAPTTTATALSSLALGMTPAEHGVVGYKFVVEGPSGREVLNVLRWTTVSGDARQFFPPGRVQDRAAFGGRPVPVVSRFDFIGTGFTGLHQQGARQVGWSVPSSIPVLTRRLLSEGQPLVYAYYEGVDKVAHAAGLGELYEAEVAYVDRLVGELIEVLPAGAALAVTADHGQVDVGAKAVPLRAELVQQCELVSGEARFRWLHARPGGADALADATRALYAEEAWVATVDEVERLGLLGGALSQDLRQRLGDVVLVPLGDQAYLDPRDSGDATLVCRHGGLSPDEVLVPLLAVGP